MFNLSFMSHKMQIDVAAIQGYLHDVQYSIVHEEVIKKKISSLQ